MNKTILLTVILFLTACTPSASTLQTAIVQTQIAQPTETIEPTATPRTDADLCEWFVKTQLLRSQRLSGLSEFTEWFQKYGTDGLVSSDYSVIAELVAILKRYQPYQEQFVEDWIELGAHPEAQEFWDKELSSVQLRIQAFDEMIEGFDEQDTDKYNHGLTVFSEAAQIGHEAESAMLEVRSQCIQQ